MFCTFLEQRATAGKVRKYFCSIKPWPAPSVRFICSSAYSFWSKIIVVEMTPYLAIMLCNVAIICSVRRGSNFRAQFKAQSSVSEKRSTGALARKVEYS